MDRLPHSGFVWHELMTTDLDGAQRFYGDVVGMSAVKTGPEPGAYRIVMFDNKQSGGLVGPRAEGPGWPSGGPTPHWVPNFGVADADEAAARAEALGGTVLLAPTTVPGLGRAAVLKDPQGAVFGVFASGEESGGSGR